MSLNIKTKPNYTSQEYCVLFWTDSGSSTRQNSSCSAIYLPSNKPSKKDEKDMLYTTGEVKTNL